MIDQADDDKPKLTRREQIFCDLYLTGLTGADAVRTMQARSRKQSPRPGQVAWRFLQRPAVKAYLAERRKSDNETFGLRKECVLRRLNNIVEGSVQQIHDERGNLIPIAQLPPDVAQSIAGVEVDQVKVMTSKATNVDGNTEVETTVETRAVKYKQWDPVRASEQLSRMMGWNKDKLEVSGNDVQPPVINISVYEDDDEVEANARAAVSSKPTPA